MKRLLGLALFLLAAARLPAAEEIPPTLLDVTNTNVSGPGSLTQAFTDSAAAPGSVIIRFNIPAPAPHVINLGTAALPAIPASIKQITVDGSTQPDYDF